MSPRKGKPGGKPPGDPEAQALRDVKAYMRVDHDDDDRLILQCRAAAVAYLRGAGVLEPEEGAETAELYRLAVHGLTLQYYDRREVDVVGSAVTPQSLGLRAVINQLKASDWGAGGDAV